MDMLLLSLSFVAGWLLGGDQTSPPPPACPPVEYPAPPADLMREPATLYLVPVDLRPRSSLRLAPLSAPD